MKCSFYLLCFLTMLLSSIWLNCADYSSSSDRANNTSASGGATVDGRNPVPASGDTAEEVSKPQFTKNLARQTGAYPSPLIVDSDGDGHSELIAAFESVFVYNSEGTLLNRIEGGSGRVYAPQVVTDPEIEGIAELLDGKSNSDYLIILDADGSLLHDIPPFESRTQRKGLW